VPGVVVWERDASPTASRGRILPDGCMDLIWDGSKLSVAGPDTRARWHTTGPSVAYVGLRFSHGIGPGLLGAPAHVVCDTMADLESLWPARPVRVLSEQVAAAPRSALEAWVLGELGDREPAGLGPVVFELADRCVSVAAMADRLGIGVRQLDRRCQPLFGYGPKHLSRVLRLGRAVAGVRNGRRLAEVAVTAGFADQAHLCREVRDLAGTTPTDL
jgi:AraC-like DNA-binding protein